MPDFGGLPRSFWVLFIGTLVNRVGGFALAFIAIYLTDERGMTSAQAGAVLSVYGIAAIIGGPIGGALSDRIGRKPTLAASLVAGGLSMLVVGFAAQPVALVAAAAAAGLLYEMYRPVVTATIADLVSPGDRPRAFNLIYWAINVGAAIAPAIGGWIAARSYRLLFAADGATTMAYGLIVWLALTETRPSIADQRDQGMGAVLRDRRFLAICALTLLFSMVFFQAFAGLPLDLRANGISPKTIGWLFAINGALIIVIQPWAASVLQRYSRARALAAGAFIVGVGYAMNAGAADWLPMRVASIVVWTLGEIVFVPVSMTLAADLAPAHLRGRYQGVFSMAYTSGFAVAPAVGGYVIGHFGATVLWIGCLAAGGAIAAGFIAFGRAERRPAAAAAPSS